MAILKNKAFAGKDLITAYGKITFSDDGTANVNDTLAAKLATLKGFSIEASEETPEDEAGEGEENASDPKDEDVENDEQTGEIPEEEDAAEENAITREELESMTVKQLEKYAKETNIDLSGATKKAEIISVILGE